MRISTHQMQQNALNNMTQQHEKLSRTQQQVSTGKRIFRPSEDPVAASRVVNLKDTLATIEQYQNNINAASARINMSEGVLENVVETLHRVRELAVQANNDTQNNSTRIFIAEEVEQLLDELISLANTTDSNNEYLFAGSLSRFKPFSRNEMGGFDYNGDENHREIQISRTRRLRIDDPGSDVFVTIKNGNGVFTTRDGETNKGTAIIDPGRSGGDFVDDTYAIVFSNNKSADGHNDQISYSVVNSAGKLLKTNVPFEQGKEIVFNGVHTSVTGIPEDNDYFVIEPSQNQDIFTTLDNLSNALSAKSPTVTDKISFHNAVNRALTDLTQALDNILSVRGNIGARLNSLDSQQTINDAYRLQIKEILSGVEDLDFAEAVSRLNLQLTGLEASQKAFTKVQDITLFNYI